MPSQVCGRDPGCQEAAGVAPEVNLSEKTGYQWPYKIFQNFLKKSFYYLFYSFFLFSQVLYQWYNATIVTVKDLVTEMVVWQQHRYLDPGVWEHCKKSLINPAVLPDDISFPTTANSVNYVYWFISSATRIHCNCVFQLYC